MQSKVRSHHSIIVTFIIHFSFILVQTYKEHCLNLNGPLKDHVATTYGIKRDSILNVSRFFHVVNALAPDVMHDILEGCLMYEVKELLNYYVNEKHLLTLNELNSCIDCFPL